MRALIVDDARVIRRSLRTFLENAGIRPQDIHEADGGVAGIEMAKEVQPTFMLLDIEMPDMSGHEVIDHVLEHDPSVKVIIISAHNREDPRIIHAISIGAFDALQKPVRQEQLVSLVNLVRKEQPGSGSIL